MIIIKVAGFPETGYIKPCIRELFASPYQKGLTNYRAGLRNK